MHDFTADETRIYAPAETPELEAEGYSQFTLHETGWTDEEKKVMLQYGYDGMDILREWLD